VNIKDKMVKEFAKSVQLQYEAIMQGNAKEGNKHADKYMRCFKELVERYGDSGREKLSSLLDHSDDRVKAMAAAYLLRYKTSKSLQILERIAKEGKFIISTGAELTIKRWKEGNWHLDE